MKCKCKNEIEVQYICKQCGNRIALNDNIKNKSTFKPITIEEVENFKDKGDEYYNNLWK